MAASLLQPPELCKSWTSQRALRLNSTALPRYIKCSSICVAKEKCITDLYLLPGKAIARNYVVKHSMSRGSVEPNVAEQKSHVYSSGLRENSSHRSKMLRDDSSNGVNELERQLHELFNEVKTMIVMGNRNDALDLLQANHEAVKEQINAGYKGIEEAAMLDVIALGYMAIGDFKFVESLLDLLSQIVENIHNKEPLLDSVFLHMGSMYSNLGKFEKSLHMYQRAVDSFESSYGQNSTFLVSPLLGMARALGSIGRTTKAVKTYQRTISILESSRSEFSQDLVIPLFNLGNILIKEGRAANAEGPFTRILEIYTRSYGDNDGRVGMAMCFLAHVKCAKGEADEAVLLYRKALQVIKDSNYMDIDDSIMEKMRIDLAELLHVVGRGEEGRQLLEECLLITEKYKGKNHPSLVTHLINLATSHSGSKNFVESERLLRSSLEIMMKTVEPDDASISFPMLQLAVTLYHLKRDKEAEQLALKVLHIREKAFGKDSLPVGEALDCLVSIQTRLGNDDDKLLELLKRVLSIQEKETGYESEEVMVTLNKIVFYLDKLGRKSERFSLQKRLSSLRRKFRQTVRY